MSPEEPELNDIGKKEFEVAMDFVENHLKDILRLLECGVVRLLGEYGETVLAYVKSTSLLKKLSEDPKSVDLHANADLKMLYNILEKRFSAEKDDIELPFQPLSVSLCRAAMVNLYNKDSELGGVGWRNAVDSGDVVWGTTETRDGV
jgi:hypothetical protein